MKKLISIAVSFMLITASAFGQAKYVFYFIGDGMGVNQVQMTELYRAAVNGNLGVEPLAFTQFPVATMSTHYSASSDVTDSAASGTALACGVKTINGRIGVDPDGNKVESVAEMAKANGKKVGIVTTVPVNHATPAAFSAHQLSRGWGYEIALDQIAEGFDFYAGSEVMDNDRDKDGNKVDSVLPKFEAAGYTICNVDEFNAGYKDMQKVLMLPGEGQDVTLAINSRHDDPSKHITLTQMVESAITFLMKDNKKGFFLMAEGGEIDHGGHSNDAASTVYEVMDMDNAIKVALEFYKKYPKQTLIVVSADHETGGLVVKPKDEVQLARLQNQKYSTGTLSNMLKESIQKSPEALSWDFVKDFLKEQLGFWDTININWEEEKRLRDIYESTVAKRKAGSVKDLYADNAKIVAEAVAILNNRSGIFWSGGGHSAGYTPVYAIGVGCEKFSHKTDNTQRPKLIKEIAAYK